MFTPSYYYLDEIYESFETKNYLIKLIINKIFNVDFSGTDLGHIKCLFLK